MILLASLNNKIPFGDETSNWSLWERFCTSSAKSFKTGVVTFSRNVIEDMGLEMKNLFRHKTAPLDRCTKFQQLYAKWVCRLDRSSQTTSCMTPLYWKQTQCLASRVQGLLQACELHHWIQQLGKKQQLWFLVLQIASESKKNLLLFVFIRCWAKVSKEFVIGIMNESNLSSSSPKSTIRSRPRDV